MKVNRKQRDHVRETNNILLFKSYLIPLYLLKCIHEYFD